MRPLVDDPTPTPASSDDKAARAALAFPLLFFGLLGVAALVVAVVIGMGNGDSSTSVGAASSEPAMVTLKEFAITPATIEATTTAGIHVMNEGTVQHNLAVDGTSLATPMIDPGSSAPLDLSSLAPGDYTVSCLVAGHASAGMTAKLHLTAGSGSASGTSAGATPTTMAMTQAQMDAAMKASIAAFPAATAGLGAQPLAPTVQADGTKQFELTAAYTDWEVSPGKTVKAMTYNGTVPGPTLKVDPGDKVRIILHNKLDQSTSIHFHGITTPNAMDGTTDVTQDPVLPGADFTYEWTAQSTPAVGM